MKNSVFGEIKSLKASERLMLEKLAGRRSRSSVLLDPELAKRAARVCHKLQRQVGLLVERGGALARVIVGSRRRIYLPDLGRYRLNEVRLRRLRLLVFLPQEPEDADVRYSSKKRVRSPKISRDLLTDLEKLRFDALVVVGVDGSGVPAGVSVATLKPLERRLSQSAGEKRGSRGIEYLHARDVYSIDVDFTEFIADLERRFAGSRTQGFEVSGDHAMLVGAYTGSAAESRLSMDELEELVRTAGVQVLERVVQRRKSLDPKTLIGKGKIEELVLDALDAGADLIIFDKELTPAQLRNISNLTELRVVDRSMLILDIFAQRAKTREGRLQVELAQLRYSLPRLTETDTGLSRLTGGIGGRGPGETKLEIGRRRVRDRIADLEKRIDKLTLQRALRRERRQSRGVPVVGIVGYTNAGKSTLLNSLTKCDVFVESTMFATLDPASRRMRFPNEKEVVFVDTVGFIRDLPKELVSAFRATLEEIGEADLLLHVVDASTDELRRRIGVVHATLRELGVGEKPCLLVLNKTDLLCEIEKETLANSLGGIPVSAITREGLKEMILRIQNRLRECFSGMDPGRFTELVSEPEADDTPGSEVS